MSELSKEEIEEYRKKLEVLRAKLSRDVHGSSLEVKAVDKSTGYSQHQADQGTDDFDRTISLELASGKFDTLRQVERALEKIEEGTYGLCDISKKPIPKRRLDAIPYATLTLEVQDQIEKGKL